MNKARLLLIAGLALAVERPTPVLAQATFSDVPGGNRALYNAVRDLAAKGILHGTPDGTFGGRRAMTRGECFLAFDRILTWFYGQLVNTSPPYPRRQSLVPLSGGKPFADVPSDWDSEMGYAVSFLDRIGLLSGYPDETLGLRRPITRDEFEMALQRLLRWMDRELVALGFAPAEAPPGGGSRK